MTLSAVILLLLTPPCMAASPAPVAGDNLTAVSVQVQMVLAQLPTWEDNRLAPYERPELAAVKADLDNCIAATPKTTDEFMQAVHQLSVELGILVALDNVLEIQGWA